MKLHSLSLENFRQFSDEQIEFSTNSEKNITVIHGQNGSGKTTLLNAFLWVLYETLNSVKRPDRIANQGAMAQANPGDTVTVSVEFEFEHDNSKHIVRREHVYRKRNEQDFEGGLVDSSFSVKYETAGDGWTSPSNPESYIRQIVPKDLSGLFFFDGEYISDLSGIDNQGEIQKAIRKMMGLTILERSIKHLEEVENRFRKELQENGSDELEALIEDRNAKQDELNDLKQRKQDKQRKKTNLQDEVQDIDDLLDQLDETAKLQEERTNLEDDRNKLENDIKAINKQLEEKISKRGFLTFAMPAIRDTAEDMDELREQGKIPSELDNAFVDELLEEKERCICDRPLEEGTQEYEAVASYKTDVSASGLDQAAIQLISHLNRVNKEHTSFFDDINDLIEDRRATQDEIDKLNGEIEDIETKIDDLTDDIDFQDWDGEISNLDLDTMSSPSDLEAARSEKKATIKELEREIGGLERDIEEAKADLEELETTISEAKEDAHEARVAQTRMQAAQAVREELDSYYQTFQNEVRSRANTKVDETYSDVSTKEYKAEITDDFRLRVIDPEHGTSLEVDKSRGERQIASLSFIGSLVDIAREQYIDKDDAEYFTGGIYPIVMDSPFGALDSNHRSEVSQILPQLADQVIVLVTDTQWDGTVETEMRGKVGKEYTLDFTDQGGPHDMPVTEIKPTSKVVTN